jgi:phage tail-like protein
MFEFVIIRWSSTFWREILSLGTKSFVFNRNSDWKKHNYSYGTKVKDHCLYFLSENGSSSAFFSKCLDSNEFGMSWGVLKARVHVKPNCKVILRVFASDSKNVIAYLGENAEKINIDKFLRGSSNFNTKFELFDKIDAIKFENPKCVPLFSLKGRYMWFCVETIGYSEEPIIVEEVEITFPLVSFSEYLPEIYQTFPSNSFMNRFIAIFQYIILETEAIIDNIPEKFEPLYTNKEFLSWICRWFDINDMVWEEDKLRYLISDMIDIFKSKGTKNSIIRMVEKYTGYKPILIEKFKITNNKFYKIEQQLVDSLFGQNDFFFTVIMNENEIKKSDDYANVLNIIKNNAPINAICNLVVLTNNILLGHHCYIGLNSYISNDCMQNSRSKDSIMIVN